jgi:hypothetical protein
MSNLADETEAKITQRMADFDRRAEMTAARIDLLSPQLDRLQGGIYSAEEFISGRLAQALEVIVSFSFR